MTTEIDHQTPDPVALTAIPKLTRDLSLASATLTTGEARFLVDSYYSMQKDRIRGELRMASLSKSGEPHSVLSWLSQQSETLESQIRRALNRYVSSHPVGAWTLEVKGIGPVIAAGLLAHIDIKKAPTVGHIWRFAGLDPTVVWRKGEKRPWNARLKTVCWKLGESFVKVSHLEGAVYGQLYHQRKEYEQGKNERGEYADTAAHVLEIKKIGKDKEAYGYYSAGKLPPAHIHARCERWAVKIFLSHLHYAWYKWEFNEEPPKPFAIAILGHAHMIEPSRKEIAASDK